MCLTVIVDLKTGKTTSANKCDGCGKTTPQKSGDRSKEPIEKYRVPKGWKTVNSFPRTATGRVAMRGTICAELCPKCAKTKKIVEAVADGTHGKTFKPDRRFKANR